MSYRKILVPVFGSTHDRSAIQAAFGLAKQFGAHVEALFVRLDPVSRLPYGRPGDISGYASQYAIEAAIKAADEAQKIAQESFDKIVDKYGVPVVAKPGARPDASAEFKIVQGDFADEIERRSRICDLVVFGATSGDDEELRSIRESFESALLSGARPVLFVPRETTEIPGRRVAIAYDGSAAAAHAVTAALPFLARAKELHAFEATADKQTTLTELQEYLALHGLSAVEHVIDPGPKTTAEALLLAVAAQKCDLLVLGGYGHSRIREFVLGGVTRHVLRHGTSLAVLMAH